MADDFTVPERVQELTWALVDEQITDDELALLDTLLLSDAEARKRYTDCVQLHAGLVAHYATSAPIASATAECKSPVLGFLNAGSPPLGFGPPVAEDVNSADS